MPDKIKPIHSTHVETVILMLRV